MDPANWGGWWDPAVASAMPAFNPTLPTISGAGPAIGDPLRNSCPGYDNGSSGHGPTVDATVLEPGFSTPTYRATTSSAPAGEPHPATPRRPRPSPTPRPLVDASPIPAGAVPDPRTSGPVDPVSGLRRRIPQSHLSAQLHTPEPERAAPVLDRPSNADAAAALSRYQASRAAAQAQMGDLPPGDPTTTTTDGGHG
jgi:hypothetical protein